MENPFKKNIEIKDEENNTSNENIEISESNLDKQAQEIPEEKPEDTTVQEESELDLLQKKYNQLNDQYIRLAADFDNYRKRQAQERESLLKYGAEKTVSQLLEVLDNFDRGLKAIETVENCEKLKECYNLAYKNFNDALIKIGLETIKAIGEEFDPNMHEAVMQTPTSEHPENVIIAELQKGYMLGEKVLRPTLVNVATAE